MRLAKLWITRQRVSGKPGKASRTEVLATLARTVPLHFSTVSPHWWKTGDGMASAGVSLPRMRAVQTGAFTKQILDI